MCSNGERIDLSKYGTEECDLCLASTNRCVNKLNKYWNELYAKEHDETLTINCRDNKHHTT